MPSTPARSHRTGTPHPPTHPPTHLGPQPASPIHSTWTHSTSLRPAPAPTPATSHPPSRPCPARSSADADFPPYGTATLVPFSYFYSVEVFEQWAAANNLRVAREVPPHLLPACFAMLQHSFTTSLSVRIRPDNGEKQVTMPLPGCCCCCGCFSVCVGGGGGVKLHQAGR